MILSLSSYPILKQILIIFGKENALKIEYIFLVALIVGIILDTFFYNIYSIFYGRLLWPTWLKEKRKGYWESFIKNKKNKMEKLNKESLEKRGVEFFLNKWFPRDEKNNYIVVSPTKLGNLVFSYENYPSWRYNLDLVDTFNQIMLIAKEEQLNIIKMKKSNARFTIFSSFSFSLLSIIYFILFTSYIIGNFLPIINVKPYAAWYIYLIYFIISAIFANIFYRASIESHRIFGEYYNATIDINIEELMKLQKTKKKCYICGKEETDNENGKYQYICGECVSSRKCI